MQIAVITDTHFGVKSESSKTMERFMDSQKLFFDEVFFPTLKNRNIKTILHLGDLFDKRKYLNSAVADHVQNIFISKLDEYDMNMTICLGNHDVYWKNTNKVNMVDKLYGTNPRVVIVDNEPLELDFEENKFLMVPWINSENEEIIMSSLEGSNADCVCGHFDIQGFEMIKGFKSTHGLNRKVFSKFPKVLSGHYHIPSEQANIKYLGSPYALNWGEHGYDTGFYIMDTSSLNMEFVKNPYSMFKVFELDTDNHSVDTIENADLDEFRNCHVKLVIVNNSNGLIVDMMKDALIEAGAVTVKVIDTSVMEFSEDEVEIEGGNTLDFLVGYVRKYRTDIEDSLKEKLVEKMSKFYQKAAI